MNGTGAGKNGDRAERGSLIRYGRALRRIAALLLFCLPFAGTALAEQTAGDFGRVGQTVTFGRYEQDYNAENGAEPIEWIVLDAREGKSLLLSRYALDTQPLDEGWEYNTTVHWRDCSLRAWLNGTFLDSAFGSGAKESILPTILVNDWEDGESPETEDRVFLLSRAEGTEYLGDEEEAWACMPTAYARSRGAMTARKSTRVSLRGLNYQMPQYGSLDDLKHEGYGWWWLRSGGPSSPIGAHVYEQGRHAYRGTIPPFYRFVTVRPALWVDAEKAAASADEPPENAPVLLPYLSPNPDAQAPGPGTKAGDTVVFGAFEQDNVEENGPEPVEWTVLTLDGNEALLISRYGLDAMRFNKYEDTSWEASAIRQWLNGYFLSGTFTEKEREALLPSGIAPADGTPAEYAGTAEDRVWLLSVEEARALFADDAARICYPTAFAVSHGANALYRRPELGAIADWWLRNVSMGKTAHYVHGYGTVESVYGSNVAVSDIVIRPVIRVDLTAACFR